MHVSAAEVAAPGKSCAMDAPARLLIVEDDSMVATYLADVLEELGFAVSGVASTGAEALSLAADGRTDLALLDINLIGPMDGIEVARQIGERFGIRAIFLSGSVESDVAARAGIVGHYGFVAKPFRPSQVYKVLDQALRERRRAGR